jgi:hypothetical protein
VLLLLLLLAVARCCRNGSFTVLPIILPLVQERLMHSNVWIREAGILALGVIAECQHESDMDAHMVHIFP